MPLPPSGAGAGPVSFGFTMSLLSFCCIVCIGFVLFGFFFENFPVHFVLYIFV